MFRALWATWSLLHLFSSAPEAQQAVGTQPCPFVSVSSMTALALQWGCSVALQSLEDVLSGPLQRKFANLAVLMFGAR